jgi:hypothetical protein
MVAEAVVQDQALHHLNQVDWVVVVEATLVHQLIQQAL